MDRGVVMTRWEVLVGCDCINHMYERVLASGNTCESLEYGIFKLIRYNRFWQQKLTL